MKNTLQIVRLLLVQILWLALVPSPVRAAEATSENDPRLKQALARYPEADANHDGILTETEARAALKKLKAGKVGAKASGADRSLASAGPTPTYADVHYGPYERNILDFWKTKSTNPVPVVVFIHGGGFVAGDKSKARGDRLLTECLDAGVSYAAINYRYRTSAPIQDVLRDCARAIQFIRSKAGEWNVDKKHIAAYGGSAGAGTSLWLAFHGDLADLGGSDPVLRESSRLAAAGATSCQFSYDILEWDKLFGAVNQKYQNTQDRPSFYGFKSEEELLSPAGQKVRADCDMRGLISKDDPPVFLNSGMPGGDITSRGHLLHHPKHALAIRDRCRELGVGVVAEIPALNIKPGPDDPQNLREFLFKHLGVTVPAEKPIGANLVPLPPGKQ